MYPDTGVCYGVLLKNGQEIHAARVVSGTGAENTFGRLLPSEALAKVGLQSQVPGVAPSNGHIAAFIGLDGPEEDFGLRSSNIHSMPLLPAFNYDISRMQEAFYRDPLSMSQCLMTLTFPSAKDPRYHERCPGRSNVLLLTEAKSEWFAEWQDEAFNERSHGYKQFKERFKPLFLERLFRYYPKCRGHIESFELGTPMTSSHFLGTPQGGSYGLEWTPQHFDAEVLEYAHIETRIAQLWLTGEFSLFGGLAGATLSGYLTAIKMLGPLSFIKVQLKRLEERLKQLPFQGKDEACGMRKLKKEERCRWKKKRRKTEQRK